MTAPGRRPTCTPVGDPLQVVWQCFRCQRPVIIRLPFLRVDGDTGEELYDWCAAEQAARFHGEGCHP